MTELRNVTDCLNLTPKCPLRFVSLANLKALVTVVSQGVVELKDVTTLFKTGTKPQKVTCFTQGTGPRTKEHTYFSRLLVLVLTDLRLYFSDLLFLMITELSL